jgi:acetyl esterase/lipase
VSPLLAEDLTNLPPAWIWTAGFDPLRDEGEAYAQRLEAAGNEVRYRCYEDQIHGFVSMGDPARRHGSDHGHRPPDGRGRPRPRRRRQLSRRPQSCGSSARAATWMGSHTGENGGAYDRSMSTTSATVRPAQIAVAAVSMRLPAPSPPMI